MARKMTTGPGAVPEGRRRQWAADRALRPPMRSPGRPEPSRAVQREFWRLIAQGVTSEKAGTQVGVSTPVATRWFRNAGGMAPICLTEPTGRYLSFAEREEIALLRAQDHGAPEIARRIGRDPSTISRALRRHAATRSSQRGYRATVAQWKAQRAAKRPNRPSSKPTRGFGGTWRASSRARSPTLRVARSQARTCPGRGGATAAGRIAGGVSRGARSRSATGFRSTSPRMSR